MLGKKPLWEVHMRVAGRRQEGPQTFHNPDSLLAGLTLSSPSRILMISSLPWYEFWKIDIPGLTPCAARQHKGK